MWANPCNTNQFLYLKYILYTVFTTSEKCKKNCLNYFIGIGLCYVLVQYIQVRPDLDPQYKYPETTVPVLAKIFLNIVRVQFQDIS